MVAKEKVVDVIYLDSQKGFWQSLTQETIKESWQTLGKR